MTATSGPDGPRARPAAPIATYRLQFRNGIGFAEASRLVPYLAALGVSDLYSSPYLQASPGSTHGYDVVNPSRVDPDLGGSAGLAELRRSLSAAGLGEVLDIVPNHMAIPGPENPWWWDVLENGAASRFARFFDVDWERGESYLRNKILLPILGDHYGRVLEAGELRLERSEADFHIQYFDRSLPVSPRSLDGIVDAAGRRLEGEAGTEEAGNRAAIEGGVPDVSIGGRDLADRGPAGGALDSGATHARRDAAHELLFIAESLAQLPPSGTADLDASRLRFRDRTVLQRLLRDLLGREPEVGQALDEVVEETNADPDRLHALLERQNYRLAFWRAAGRELGYRRFFDVTGLVGIRQEDPTVFESTHPLIDEWLETEALDGLRVDHPDGLRDPKEYLERLRRYGPKAWIVVEKILEPGERLREDWPVAGTTGYDFLFVVNNLFVDRGNEAAMTKAYAAFTGDQRTYREIALESKRQILRDVLATELARLAALLLEICERHRRYRDYTRHDLHEAMLELAACFPVYRTYVRPWAGQIEAADRRAIDDAAELAERERPTIDGRLLDFIRQILTLEVTGELESEFVARFQQLTGPVMAKGIEDTAFYRYVRLTSLNEVGGDPSIYGIAPDVFHRSSEERQAVWSATMLSTSTHDTKRAEDVRARISLLSEIPERWAEAVARWSELAEKHKTAGMPDRNTQWLYYQTLVGAWPLSVDRAAAYMEKATREAKAATSWATPNEEFEAATRSFVEATLSDPAFIAEVESFVTPLIRPGQVASLAQTLLKIASPGVPDIYQGTDLWDLSLVDPDNRRPVDFERRSRLLHELCDLPPAEALEAVARNWDEGAPKLWLIHRALGVRARYRESFGGGGRGSYAALIARGPQAERVVSFVRGGNVVAVVPRLVLTLSDWGDTSLALPAGRWRDELSGLEFEGGDVSVGRLLARFPVALLVAVEPAS